MAIALDEARAPLPPVANVRDFGQKVRGMVIDKWVRDRQKKDGTPIKNARGKIAQEEVLTLLALEGTTGTVTMGSGLDSEEKVPAAGEVIRLIFKSRTYGQLIDARKKVGGNTQVGDVIEQTALTATIWAGEGEIAAQDVTDPAKIAKARQQNFSVGWNTDIEYRRPNADEAGLVAKCEQLYHERQKRVDLDRERKADVEPDDAF